MCFRMVTKISISVDEFSGHNITPNLYLFWDHGIVAGERLFNFHYENMPIQIY